MSAVPRVTFYDGHSCPILGFGTWFPEPVTEIMKTAIDVGYRHFDCAAAYRNEHKIGAAFTDKIKEGAVKREDIFVTSKLPAYSNRPALVEVEIKNSLQNLGLEYLDLYMIHWPQSYKEGLKLETYDDYRNGVPGNVDFVDVWKAMEYLVDKGLTKSIGLSNFNKRQIDRIMKVARIKPAVLQKSVNKSYSNANFDEHRLSSFYVMWRHKIDSQTVKSFAYTQLNNIKKKLKTFRKTSQTPFYTYKQIEVHPYLNQVKLIDYCTSLGIRVTACAPLGSPERPWAKPTDPVLFEDQRIKPIADKYGKSLVQVLIRYAVERDLIVIPKSAIKYQMEENINVFDFKLSPEDMKIMGALECNFRYCNLGDVHHPEHPFHDEY